MSMYTMKEILADAKARCYGVGYFNATDMHMVRAYIAAAEELHSPIIIGTAECLLKDYGSFDWIAPVLITAAQNAKVPVAVHLDHTYNFDTIMNAIRHGFGSVMFDGSRLPYESNIEQSALVSRAAHAVGVGVEFELGCVGGLEGTDGTADQNIYTDPDLAGEFVNNTHADFLAVSIGTIHGVYQAEPKLNFLLLEQLKARVNIPLVLHGGSGLTNEDFSSSIAGGICKINIYTDIVLAGSEAVKNQKDKQYADILLVAEQAMKEATMKKIQIFKSADKA